MSLVTHLINKQILGGGGSTASSTLRFINASFPDAVAAMVGKLRWYPPAAIAVKKVSLFIDTSPTSALVVDVKKNGVSIFGATKPTLDAGQNISTPVEVDVALASTDYLTVDVISGGGSDMTVRIDYQ